MPELAAIGPVRKLPDISEVTERMAGRIGAALLWPLALAFLFVGFNKNDPYLISLRGTSRAGAMPGIVDVVRRLPVTQAVLDGDGDEARRSRCGARHWHSSAVSIGSHSRAR